MPAPVTISKTQARKLALSGQGLLQRRPFGSGKSGTRNAIRALGYVQIDTISVIERAHHHVIRSRVPGYAQQHLWELQSKDRSIFEYWSHAAAFLPIEDFRFTLPRKQWIREKDKHWFPRDKKVMRYVLDRIRAEGPLQSRDFEHPKKEKSEWYVWKPAKMALEQLFQEGELMISERRGFQKVFDLTERVLPPDTDTRSPTPAENARHLLDLNLSAHGLVSSREILHLRKGLKSVLGDLITEMTESRELLALQIKGLEESYFTSPERLQALSSSSGKKQLQLLSPFDNAVILRQRLKNIFDFDYQIECYVPKPKRIYGYFSQPMLWGNRFVGRLDAKADRKDKRFLVHSIWLEDGFVANEEFAFALAAKLKWMADAHHCEELTIGDSNNSSLRAVLKSVL